MLFGLIARMPIFAINAGLVFLLSQHVPQLGWESHPTPGMLENARNDILTGLARVRVDLETHGKLLFPAKGTAGALALERPALQLDRRTPRAILITD